MRHEPYQSRQPRLRPRINSSSRRTTPCGAVYSAFSILADSSRQAMTSSSNSLRDAVFRGRLDEVMTALGIRENKNCIDADGRTALLHAVIDGSTPIVELLIREELNVNHQDKLGYAVLHHAAQQGLLDIVNILLDNGAKVNVKDVHGNTPLSRAVFSFDGDESVINRLLAADANPNLKNNHGVSPKELAHPMGDEISQFI